MDNCANLQRSCLDSTEEIEKVEKLQVGDRTFKAWQEAVEEVIEVAEFDFSALALQSMQWPFRLSAKQEREAMRNEANDDCRGCPAR